MGISLSGGPWQYNRFDQFNEAAKPDYLDFDKDGDKKESMKKALKEKGGKKCPKCGKSPCECDKSDMKEWVEEMVQEGIDLSEYTWDDMVEIFNEGKGMHREADTGKVVDKAEIGKTYYPNMPKKKTSVKKKPDAFGGRFKKESKEYRDPVSHALETDKKLMKIHNGDKKKKVTKEEVLQHLMDEGFANNPVSAEIMFNHMSEEWLNAIEEAWKPMNTSKVVRQRDKAYDKEQAAVRSGDEKEVNKQMQRRIAMTNPSGRKAGLENKKN